LGCKVVISVGIPVYNYCDVSKSYATAKDLQDYFLIFPSKNIALYNAIQTSTFPPLSKLKANFSKFDDLLLIKDKAALKRFIVNTYDQLKQASVTPQQLQIFTVELVLKFLHSVKSKHRNSVYLFSDLKNSLAEVLSQRNIEGVVKHLSLIVEITVDSILAQEAKTNPLVKNVLNYVNENYAGNISLKILSDRFNLSAAYLGQLFKNETGEMFTNYLNAIRVKNSNELLRNTTLKINEIAEKVGYVNQIYFTRIYKKVTGLTPIEFRKHNQ
jgi:two-component system response regulator YesN